MLGNMASPETMQARSRRGSTGCRFHHGGRVVHRWRDGPHGPDDRRIWAAHAETPAGGYFALTRRCHGTASPPRLPWAPHDRAWSEPAWRNRRSRVGSRRPTAQRLWRANGAIPTGRKSSWCTASRNATWPSPGRPPAILRGTTAFSPMTCAAMALRKSHWSRFSIRTARCGRMTSTP